MESPVVHIPVAGLGTTTFSTTELKLVLTYLGVIQNASRSASSRELSQNLHYLQDLRFGNSKERIVTLLSLGCVFCTSPMHPTPFCSLKPNDTQFSNKSVLARNIRRALSTGALFSTSPEVLWCTLFSLVARQFQFQDSRLETFWSPTYFLIPTAMTLVTPAACAYNSLLLEVTISSTTLHAVSTAGEQFNMVPGRLFAEHNCTIFPQLVD
eukprot:2429672-Amphidinium_carterae.2